MTLWSLKYSILVSWIGRPVLVTFQLQLQFFMMCTCCSADGVCPERSGTQSAAGRRQSAVLHCATVCKGSGRGIASLSEGPQTRVVGVPLHCHHESQLCQGTNNRDSTSHRVSDRYSDTTNHQTLIRGEIRFDSWQPKHSIIGYVRSYYLFWNNTGTGTIAGHLLSNICMYIHTVYPRASFRGGIPPPLAGFCPPPPWNLWVPIIIITVYNWSST